MTVRQVVGTDGTCREFRRCPATLFPLAGNGGAFYAMFNDRRAHKAETAVSTSQLERLARSREAAVRRGVAMNPNTPEHVLLLLAEPFTCCSHSPDLTFQ